MADSLFAGKSGQPRDLGKQEQDVEDYRGELALKETHRTSQGAGEGLASAHSPNRLAASSNGEAIGLFDFDSESLAEIYKKVMSTIDEHKEQITTEFKNAKREYDIEKGNSKSNIKLAKKEKRSNKTIEQREKEDYVTRRRHMSQLHQLLMKHHFSLCNVEESCAHALKDEWISYIQATNRIELHLWRRTCQDFHETLDIPLKGFTVKKKWKQVTGIIKELLQIIDDGIAAFGKFYTERGIKPQLHFGKDDSWKCIHYLEETKDKLNQQEKLLKKSLITQWSTAGEKLKEFLGKCTLLVHYDQRRRLHAMEQHSAAKLIAFQEKSTKRHGKLMQKIAKEQQLLDKGKSELKHRQNRKPKRLDMPSDNLPNDRLPMQMPSGVGSELGSGGIGGMGTYNGRMGGYGGEMRNYNMSNSTDMPACNTEPDASGESHLDVVQSPGEITPELGYLSSKRVASISCMDKLEILDKYFALGVQSWTSSPDAPYHPIEGDDLYVNENMNAVIIGEDNYNANADSSDSSGSYSDSTSAKKSKSVKKGKGKTEKKPAGKGKSGSLASRLFGFGKKNKEPSTTTSTGSGPGDSSSDDDDSDSESTTGSSSSRSQVLPDNKKSKKTVQQTDGGSDSGDVEYKEFESNEHKDKWTIKYLCRHCNMDKLVNKVCPCFREQYQDFKEKRDEKRRQKALKKDVLLRLRDEASRSRNI